MIKIESFILAGLALILGLLTGGGMAIRQVHKDCQEFGGAKRYSGTVIACQVEVLKP